MRKLIYSCTASLGMLPLPSGIALAHSSTDGQPVPLAGLEEWSDAGQWCSEQEGIVVANKSTGDAIALPFKSRGTYRFEMRKLMSRPLDR